MNEQFSYPPIPEAAPERAWPSRLETFRRQPLGKLTTAIATVLALSAADHAETVYAQTQTTASTSIVAEADPSAPNVSLQLGEGEQAVKLKLDDWKDTASLPQTNEPLITPNAALQELVDTQEPFTNEIGLTPANIEQPAAFTAWVQQQAGRPDLLETLHIQANNPRTPHQLVDLSAAIVMSNVDYNTDLTWAEGMTMDQILEKANYRKPIDQILTEHMPIQCEGYAASTKAVFDELKKLFPDELKNTYMTTQSGIMEGHVWDLVIQVQDPNTASMAFIDATADDPSYFKTEPEIRVGFVQLLEGLFDKGALDQNAFNALITQYNALRELTPEDQRQIEEDQFYLDDKHP